MTTFAGDIPFVTNSAAGPRLYERAPVDQITRQAREVRPGKVLLGLIGGLLFFIGWSVAKLSGVVWFAGVWAAVAIRTGWREAKGHPLEQPDINRVLAENERLRAELSRVT